MTIYTGDSGNNIFTGGSADDTAVGNGGNDNLSGNGGNDVLVGNAGSDTLSGGDGEDTLYSADESPPYGFPYYGNPYTPPLLDTGSEVDTLAGGDGSDRIFAGYGDNVDGGTDGYYGDYLFISFLGAPAGVTVDFRLTTQTVGGGTITGIENISWVQGSNFDDYINVASSTNNGYSDFTAVFGMGGNDQLLAGYYTGVLDGGDGNDIVDGRGSGYLQAVYGGAGDDTLYTDSNTFAIAYGDAGNDTIYAHGETYGGDGNDTIVMSYSYYTGPVAGEAGDDKIDAAEQGNTISGGSGADTINGNAGADMLGSADFATYPDTFANDMALEQDVLSGFGGDDLLAIGYGDSADGGTGSDTLRLSLGGRTSGITFSTAGIVSGQPFALGGGTIQNVETLEYLRGTDFNDNLTLVTQASLLTVDAGAGHDVITSKNSSVDVRGGDGNDRFVSGAAGDTFDGGAGIDTIDYRQLAAGVNIIIAEPGTSTGAGGDQFINVENVYGTRYADTITGQSGANILRGNSGDDMLDGAAGADQLYGDAGNDSLYGGLGNDRLNGGTGSDHMQGGSGNDIYYVDSSGDTVAEYFAADGNDLVYSSISYVLGDNLERLTLTGTSNLAGTGNALANTIFGNAGANTLRGADGNDRLNGAAGNDVIYGGNGADAVNGAAGDDKLYGNADNDVLRGEGGNDWIEGGAGRDQLYGGTGADSFVFGVGTFTSTTSSTADIIYDFSQAQSDLIRLDALDANRGVTGNQAFAFIGTSAFGGNAGELRYEQIGSNTFVQGDTNGDGVADFWIRVDGLHTLTGGDFVL